MFSLVRAGKILPYNYVIFSTRVETSHALYASFIVALSRSTALSGAVKIATARCQPMQEAVSKRTFSLLSSYNGNGITNPASLTRFVAPVPLAPSTNIMPCRTLIKFDIQHGKRKELQAAKDRFFRLHWGGWIRARCGRHKKMHQKSSNRKRRLRQHVMLNATQSMLIDKMVSAKFRRPKHYINDPYEPYHTRDLYRARAHAGSYPEQPLTEYTAKFSETFTRYQPKSVYE